MDGMGNEIVFLRRAMVFGVDFGSPLRIPSSGSGSVAEFVPKIAALQKKARALCFLIFGGYFFGQTF